MKSLFRKRAFWKAFDLVSQSVALGLSSVVMFAMVNIMRILVEEYGIFHDLLTVATALLVAGIFLIGAMIFVVAVQDMKQTLKTLKKP